MLRSPDERRECDILNEKPKISLESHELLTHSFFFTQVTKRNTWKVDK